jgi:hypothetical protein
MPSLPASGVDRRLFLSSVLGVAAGVAGLSGCAGNSAVAGSKGVSSAPLADKVPAGTSRENGGCVRPGRRRICDACELVVQYGVGDC